MMIMLVGPLASWSSGEHAALQPSSALTTWPQVLSGRAGTESFWVNGFIPDHDPTANNARVSCPSSDFRIVGDLTAGVALCPAYFPFGEDMVVIGVGGNYDFERVVGAAPLGTHVHAFDPTEELKDWHIRNAPANVSFHDVGLGSASGASASDEAAGESSQLYGTISPLRLKTLSELYSVSGADAHGPAVLKIDCEGCEWPALEQVARETPWVLDNVQVLMMEVHVTPLLNPPTPEQFDTLFSLLTSKGFKLWYLRENVGAPENVGAVDFLTVLGWPQRLCCYELGFVHVDQAPAIDAAPTSQAAAAHGVAVLAAQPEPLAAVAVDADVEALLAAQLKGACAGGIFIDAGANIGMHARFLFEANHYPESLYQKVFDANFGAARDNVCAVEFEPNLDHRQRLERLSAAYNAHGWNTIYAPFGVWDTRGNLTFYHNNGAKNAMEEVSFGSENVDHNGNALPDARPVVLQTIDLARFLTLIEQQQQPQRRVVIKMDIEGAEFVALPKLIRSGALCSAVDAITAEFHAQKVPTSMKEELPTPEAATAYVAQLQDAVANATGCRVASIDDLDDETYLNDRDESQLRNPRPVL